MFLACVAQDLEVSCSADFVFAKKFSLCVGWVEDVGFSLEESVCVEVTEDDSVVACCFHSTVEWEEAAFFD